MLGDFLQQFGKHHAKSSLVWRAANHDDGVATADFDQDGDTDVAGAGTSGEMVTLENKGSLLNGPFVRTVYPEPSSAYFGSERIGLVEDGSVAFPLNQQHIADALGLSLVHTNKTLRRLSALGLHELKNGRLRMLNTRALARVAEYYDRPPRLLPLL